MKKLLRIMALMVPLMIFSCDEKIDPSDYIITYSDLKIVSVTIPDIPAYGGDVQPVVKYTYTMTTDKWKSIEEQTLDSGAEVQFSTKDPDLHIDNAKGLISAGVNETVTERTFDITVTVTLDKLMDQSQATAKQTANKEEIVKSETIQLPLQLEPHTVAENIVTTAGGRLDWYENPGLEEKTYSSDSKDGKDANGNLEIISVMGTTLKVTGGQLATINTYRSGKVDTVIVKEPEYKTEVYYRTLSDAGDGYEPGMTPPENHIDPPTSSFGDGTWTINKVGIGAKDMNTNPMRHNDATNYDIFRRIWRYMDIKHTLTATVDDHVQTIELKQQQNAQIGYSDPIIEIKDFFIYVQREYFNWPNIEDYPPGSNPKWIKDYELYTDEVYDKAEADGLGFFTPELQLAWHEYKDTKDLHPDGNRDIMFIPVNKIAFTMPQQIYLSGDKSEILTINTYFDTLTWAKATATAKVVMKDGTTKDISHTYEWDIDKHYLTQDFLVELPVIENAAEDFEWTIKFEYDILRPGKNDAQKLLTLTYLGAILRLPDTFLLTDEAIRKYSNYYEYQWTNREYKAMDRLSSVEKWAEEAKVSGFISCDRINGFRGQRPYYIDGVVQYEDGNGNDNGDGALTITFGD